MGSETSREAGRACEAGRASTGYIGLVGRLLTFCASSCCLISSGDGSIEILTPQMSKIPIWVYGFETQHSPDCCGRGFIPVCFASPVVCAENGGLRRMKRLISPPHNCLVCSKNVYNEQREGELFAPVVQSIITERKLPNWD